MSERITYDFSVLCLVPHPHLDASTPIGVVVHARTEEYLAARVLTDPARLRAIAPELDLDRLIRYLENWLAIAEGQEGAGSVAHYPSSERFHWLAAPRSDVLQAQPARRGLTDDLPGTLERLWADHVEG